MKAFITTLFALSVCCLIPSCGSLQALNVNPSVNVSPKVQVEISPFSGLRGPQLVVDGTVKKVYLLDGLSWVDVKCGDKVVKTAHKKTCSCCKVGDKVRVQGTSYEVLYKGSTHLYLKDCVVL